MMMMLPLTRVFGLRALLSSAASATDILRGKQYEDYCTYTTWVGETSINSPLADDCIQLAKSYENAHSGIFLTSVGPDTFSQLGWHGTCAFGVRPVIKAGRKTNIWFGSTDIHDLVFDATMRFKNTRTGKIGASGVAHCGDTQVNWGVYHKT
ncbi:hypothetical protein PG994_011369 [Apiospora phragmitis]|uniref:Ecp2 effector protein-like domain-containing protein n=1 Tax=Apiospora phragmitis TaxID=2905665 RepID=A0ABR1TV98_9PEZI